MIDFKPARRLTLCVGCVLCMLAFGFSLRSARAQVRGEEVWFGPMAFIEGRDVRDDFVPMLLDTEQWPELFARIDVFKSYIMILPDVPVPGNSAPELSDDDLRALIALFEQNGIQVAFEVGGARSRMPGAGVAAAEQEFQWLSRWIELGGKIDFLTTDHSIAFAIEDWLTTIDPAESGAMTYFDEEVQSLIRDACSESASYIERMTELIPGVRFGAIESLGYWYVVHGSQVYLPTRLDLPWMPFDLVLRDFVDALNERGLTLDHFHTDFGYEGVEFDGRFTASLDYGRILGIESIVKLFGAYSGNIVNAFHNRSNPYPIPATANVEAFAHTLAFFDGYAATGQTADQIVLQTWQPYPDATGPAGTDFTVMNMHRTLVLRDNFPTERGYYRVSIEPALALAAGAAWSIDGGENWQAEDAIMRTTKGEHAILFKPLEGWDEPSSLTMTLNNNTTTVIEGDATFHQRLTSILDTWWVYE